MEFTTREGSKAANVNQLFRIENVIFVTSLHDTASKRREQQQREKKQSRSFESILQEACTETGQREISYSTAGYTKNGTAYHHFEKRREYVHQ
ncbi:MAG: hypothetical protein K2P45_00295 [Eubacterium sp.]|nr:hypothetical protein [Eubacterium sp.]